MFVAEKSNKSNQNKRNRFTQDDDQQLLQLINQYGILNWNVIAEKMISKNARQCKERWDNYLNPNINNSGWTFEEDELLLKKYEEFGSKWVKIAKHFNNRTDTQCKNRIQKLQRRCDRCTQLMKEIKKVPSLEKFKDNKQNQIISPSDEDLNKTNDHTLNENDYFEIELFGFDFFF
jgi:hypothetical protein